MPVGVFLKMKTWLITGAQAGVGKTTLMNALHEILPNAMCLKLGHGMRKVSGVKNFFTDIDEAVKFIKDLDEKYEHCLVESNRLLGKIKADVIIFLDTLDGDRRRDADRLRAMAHIVIDKKKTENKWLKGLARLNIGSKEKDAVMSAFRDQAEYLGSSRLALRTKLWFSHDGLMVFGEGLARLLKGIETFGSLSAAAKEECISYRHAWGDIRRAEERLGFSLIESSPGGSEGGGSTLTEKGKMLLKGYEELRRKVVKSSDKLFHELLSKIEDRT